MLVYIQGNTLVYIRKFSGIRYSVMHLLEGSIVNSVTFFPQLPAA